MDIANGHMTCGCPNIAYCKVNAPFGTCDIPVLSPPPPAQLALPPQPDGSFGGFGGFGSAEHATAQPWWFSLVVFIVLIMLLVM